MNNQCSNCKNYFVTWDKKAPRGCRAYGFKTSAVPSLVVLETTSTECLKFETNPNMASNNSDKRKNAG